MTKIKEGYLRLGWKTGQFGVYGVLAFRHNALGRDLWKEVSPIARSSVYEALVDSAQMRFDHCLKNNLNAENAKNWNLDKLEVTEND